MYERPPLHKTEFRVGYGKNEGYGFSHTACLMNGPFTVPGFYKFKNSRLLKRRTFLTIFMNGRKWHEVHFRRFLFLNMSLEPWDIVKTMRCCVYLHIYVWSWATLLRNLTVLYPEFGFCVILRQCICEASSMNFLTPLLSQKNPLNKNCVHLFVP